MKNDPNVTDAIGGHKEGSTPDLELHARSSHDDLPECSIYTV
jgi:hypothetical protein